MLRIVFVGTCNCIIRLGFIVQLVGIEFPVISVGDVFSVVSALCIFILKSTEVVCVWGWKPIQVFWFDVWALFLSVIIDWVKHISSVFRSRVLFAVMSLIFTLGKTSYGETTSVLIRRELRFFEWTISLLIKNESDSSSVNWFENFSKQLSYKLFQKIWKINPKKSPKNSE